MTPEEAKNRKSASGSVSSKPVVTQQAARNAAVVAPANKMMSSTGKASSAPPYKTR